jgi:glycosyltransferase involved in cell wall biosynthesis
MKILWAYPYYLFNRVDGGAISVINLLEGLAELGHSILVVGLRIGEGDELKDKTVFSQQHGKISIISMALSENDKNKMTNEEANKWLGLYMSTLNVYAPDLVMSLGGESLDMHVYAYAKFNKIKNAAFVINTNFKGNYWHRDVDYFFTDSLSTANHYKELLNIDCIPVGVFVSRNRRNLDLGINRNYVTFINSIPSKGSILVAQIIIKLSKKRPDIKFRVISSRGKTEDSFAQAGETNIQNLNNIEILESYSDLSVALNQTRLLLAPSLAKESYGMVVTEAKYNNIPSIVTNIGGLPEAVGNGGDVIDIPLELFNPPYESLASEDVLEIFSDLIIKYFDNQDYYNLKVEHCRKESEVLTYENQIENFNREILKIING